MKGGKGNLFRMDLPLVKGTWTRVAEINGYFCPSE